MVEGGGDLSFLSADGKGCVFAFLWGIFVMEEEFIFLL